MAEINVRVKTDAKERRYADLPTYTLVREVSPTVWRVRVPDEYLGDNGRLDNDKMHRMYDYSQQELARLQPEQRARAASLKTKDFAAEEDAT